MRGAWDGPAGMATFNWPTGVAVDSTGVIYVADFSNNLIRKITKRGEVETLAGSGMAGFADGMGRDAVLKGPDNIVIDSEGNLFFADADNFRIRKVSPDGYVSTVAGSGIRGYRDGSAEEAMFGYPTGIAVDRDGNIFVADRGSHTVRKITPTGRVVTVAGNGKPGFADGVGRKSSLREPISVAVGGDGRVYIADSGNNAIRVIHRDGFVGTLAGGGGAGYRDGRGRDALFYWPTGIAVEPLTGYIYVCDSQNNKIRRITPQGVVSTIAGVLLPGRLDGPAYRSQFNFPTGIDVDRDGNIYIADSGNNIIRKIYPKDLNQDF